ncbi:hypothetical protein NPIL_590201 [Nephila pilipes]|uniref:Uncharacterized protein n=1 Tax=Nephila pilipes TaxID=299642 RepID=A0A8X6NRV5_NEPPI|nr:hypothetical protein NPIL_590201 [Nephila pilipes]
MSETITEPCHVQCPDSILWLIINSIAVVFNELGGFNSTIEVFAPNVSRQESSCHHRALTPPHHGQVKIYLQMICFHFLFGYSKMYRVIYYTFDTLTQEGDLISR